jgi:phage major head subunit gpT-like protein
MIVNEVAIAALFTGFKKLYKDGFGAAEVHYDKIAMTVPSQTREEAYGWLGQFPQLREWLDGDRVVKDLKAHGFTIENRKFESTISIRREDIADDRVGVFSTQFAEMGHRARQHPDEMIFDLLSKGFTTPCFDGQYFFDTDHPAVGADGLDTAVSNMQDGANAPWFLMDTSRMIKPVIWQEREGYDLQTVNNQNDYNVFMTDIYHFGIRARVNAGFGLWQLAFGSKADLTPENYAAARASMMKLRGDQGRILGIKPTVLVVGPELEEMGHRIVNSENAAGGDTNPWKGSASLIVSPYLGG